MSAGMSAAYGNRLGGAPNYTPIASLTTPTYEGSGQTTEPTWIVKPSWATGVTATDLLAHNPLPSGDDDYENPSLLISNDLGSTWANPPALTNPIAAKPTAIGAAGNNADCYLLADPNANRLIMFWGVYQDPNAPGGVNANGIWYSTCTATNLGTWSARVQLMSRNGGNLIGDGGEQEPKVIWNPLRNRYWMWTQHDPTCVVRWRESVTTDPLGAYTQPTVCTIPVPSNGVFGAGVVWHMDIIRESNGRWIMALCDSYQPGGTYNRRAWIATSYDGIRWKVAPRPIMLVNAWAINGVYRPSIIPARTGNGYDIIVSRQQVPNSRMGLTRNIPKTEIP